MSGRSSRYASTWRSFSHPGRRARRAMLHLGRGEMLTITLASVATLEPLARWLPHLRHLRRLPLTSLPTPVEALERFGRAAGIAPPWIKRDDLSGVIYGGNKPRKLELLLGAA